MDNRYLETGEIVAVQGIRGEVRVYPWCDDPSMLTRLQTLYLGKEHRPIAVEHGHMAKNVVVLKLAGIDTVEQAQKLRGTTLYLDREDLDLPEGTFFVADLLGMTAKDADTGKVYGVLTDVISTGANDVYTIRSEDGTEYLMPAVEEMVPLIDLENKVMLLRPIPGIFDGEALDEPHD